MKRPLIILGASGLAREMAMMAEQLNASEHCWDILGFISELKKDVGKNLGIASVIGDDGWLLSQDFEADLLIGVGYPKLRATILTPYLEQHTRFRFPNLIHTSATSDYRRLEIGRGNVITAGCRLTCDIRIGDFNLFNLNTTVGHDVSIGNFNVINPGTNISGGVHMADRILAGTGCQILENLTIGSDAVIGAGAVVVKDVSASQTVAGIPAKPLEKQKC